MPTAIDDLFVASTGDPGVLVAQNATQLNGGIDDVTTTIVCDDDVFADGDEVIIDMEIITIGTGGPTYTGCTRGGGAGAASHADGANVRLNKGTQLLAFTFTGAESMSVIEAGGETEAWYGIMVGTTIKAIRKSNPENTQIFFPMSSITPDTDDVIEIRVWSWYNNHNHWASIYK